MGNNLTAFGQGFEAANKTFKKTKNLDAFKTEVARLIGQLDKEESPPFLTLIADIRCETTDFIKGQVQEQSMDMLGDEMQYIAEKAQLLQSVQPLNFEAVKAEIDAIVNQAGVKLWTNQLQYFGVSLALLTVLLRESRSQKKEEVMMRLAKETKTDVLHSQTKNMQASIMIFIESLLTPSKKKEEVILNDFLPRCQEIDNLFAHFNGIFQENAYFSIQILTAFMIMHLSLLSIATKFTDVKMKLSKCVHSYPLLLSRYVQLASDQRKSFIKSYRIRDKGKSKERKEIPLSGLKEVPKDASFFKKLGRELADGPTPLNGTKWKLVDELTKSKAKTTLSFSAPREVWNISEYIDREMKCKFQYCIDYVNACIQHLNG